MDTTRVRRDDYQTSIEGAEAVESRAENQQTALLKAFTAAGETGLTDEEAAAAAGLLGSCYWKRCGELRRAGRITFNGQTRRGGAGVSRKVSVFIA